MPATSNLARYQSLCLDVNELDAMTGFWSQALGLRVARALPDVVRLDGETPQHTVWLNRVPEPHTVKNRVHVDLHASGPDALPGATPLSAEGELPWRVMADPEGNELCVFSRDEVPAYRLYEVVVDCEDAAATCAWWSGVLGGRVEHAEEGWYSLEEAPGMPFGLVFGSVPEPKTVKNRVHWDIDVDTADGLQQLVERGARVLREPDDEVRWTVMADPEGNEFDAFVVE